MRTNKLLKSLLADSYETQNNLVELIKECFEEIFKDESSYAFNFFEDDLESRDYCGCLQDLEYYKGQIKQYFERMDATKKLHDQTKE